MAYSPQRDAASEGAENLFANLLLNNGFIVHPSQLLSKAKPALALRPNDETLKQKIPDYADKPNIVLPDFLAFKGGKAFYYEVKAKKPWNGSIGMNTYTLHHAVELEANSGIPVFYVVYRTDLSPVSAADENAFVLCPISTLHAELGRPKHNQAGESYYAWPLDLFEPLRSHFAAPLDLHSVRIPPRSPLGPYLGAHWQN